MDIAFAPRSGWRAFRYFFSSRSGVGREEHAVSPAADFYDYPADSLRRDGALFRVAADVEPTEEGVRAFLREHADLGAEPACLLIPVAGEACAVFPKGYDADARSGRAVAEVLMLRRCVRLWDMVQRKDQAQLARYIKPFPDAGPGRFIYDSHPDLPRGAEPEPPDRRDASIIDVVDANPERKEKAKSEDLRPAARAYLAVAISKKLEGGLNVRVSDSPGSRGPMLVHEVPRTFLAALWHQFKEEVTGNFTPSRCLACQTWFRPVKHRKKMYCTANPNCKVTAHRMRKKIDLLLAEGKSLEDVAAELGRDVSVIQKLIASREEKRGGAKAKG